MYQFFTKNLKLKTKNFITNDKWLYFTLYYMMRYTYDNCGEHSFCQVNIPNRKTFSCMTELS